jgi:hypothetical protein
MDLSAAVIANRIHIDDRWDELQNSLCVRHEGRSTSGLCLSAHTSQFCTSLQLKMNNNELNFMDIYYRIGYAIFLMPCQIILTKVNPRWWMPSNEMAWGVMTGTIGASCPRS